jgi:SAM-dependent methyltransferase
MSTGERGQVTREAADVYEEFFLPALFEQWAPRVADAAQVRAGQRVLDVACGTGVLAREVANLVGPTGAVVGLDVNDGMLAVARRKAPAVEWQLGRAEALPYENSSFDAVVSQFGLMFFEDRPAALREMLRVLRPGGGLAVAVWASLDQSPGYASLVDLSRRLFGEEVASALRAPFSLGDTRDLRALFAEAGVPSARIMTLTGTARFPSVESWIYTDVRGWTLADVLDDAQFDRLLGEAKVELGSFVTTDGTVVFDAPAHVATVTKP